VLSARCHGGQSFDPLWRPSAQRFARCAPSQPLVTLGSGASKCHGLRSVKGARGETAPAGPAPYTVALQGLFEPHTATAPTDAAKSASVRQRTGNVYILAREAPARPARRSWSCQGCASTSRSALALGGSTATLPVGGTHVVCTPLPCTCNTHSDRTTSPRRRVGSSAPWRCCVLEPL
jgi:hypothetical protein